MSFSLYVYHGDLCSLCSSASNISLIGLCNMNVLFYLNIFLLLSKLQMKREELLTLWPMVCSCCWGRRGRAGMLRKPRCRCHIWSCTRRYYETCWSCTPSIKSFISERMKGGTRVIQQYFETYTFRLVLTSYVCPLDYCPQGNVRI